MMLMFIRHGQTDWNLEERYQGRLDVPLNDVGRRQAKALKRRLAEVCFDTAYSSPLRRALETAQIIANDLHIIVDERLAEIDHGLWQGRTKAEIASRWPEQWEQWSKEPLGFTAPCGESAARVRERLESFLRTIEGKNILCVSHGVVIQTLPSVLLAHPFLEDDTYVPANGSIHTIRFRGRDVYDYRIEQIA